MIGLFNGLKDDALVLPSVLNFHCIRIVEKVKSLVAQRARGVILEEVCPKDFSIYEKVETLQLQKVSQMLRDILVQEAIPAVRSYVESRYPQELAELTEAERNGMFGNIELLLCSQPTTLEDCERPDQSRPLGSIGSCGFAMEGDLKVREIHFFLNDFLMDKSVVGIDRESIGDAMVQVLMHEYFHAVSAKRHHTPEEDETSRRMVAFREEYLGDMGLYYEDLSSSFGYALNFIDRKDYRTVKGLNDFNEGLTDVLAAKAYTEFTRKKYGKAKKYSVSYMLESHALYRIVRQFAVENGLKPQALMRDLEVGYLFDGPGKQDRLHDLVLPMMEAFVPTLAAQREATRPTPVLPGLILPLRLQWQRSKRQRPRQA